MADGFLYLVVGGLVLEQFERSDGILAFLRLGIALMCFAIAAMAGIIELVAMVKP